MEMDETTEQCAIRELEEETGLRLSDVHQIGAYSKVDRDPRGRTITVAYLAIVDEPIAVTGQDDAAKAEWWPLSDLPHLAFSSISSFDKDANVVSLFTPKARNPPLAVFEKAQICCASLSDLSERAHFQSIVFSS